MANQKYLVWLDTLNNVRSIPKPIQGYQNVVSEFAKRRDVADGTVVAIGTAAQLKASYEIRHKNWEKEDGTSKI
jgi:hypothetical protein